MDYENYCGYNLNEIALKVDHPYGFRMARRFWSGEKRFHATQLTVGIVDDMLAGDKDRLPIVNFDSVPGVAAIVADFDNLPRTYLTWDDFYATCKARFIDGCVTRSASGKVKVIFLIKKQLGIDYGATLRFLIDDLAEFADPSRTAMTQTFLTTRIFADLREWLSGPRICYDPVLRDYVEINVEALAKEYVEVVQQVVELLRPSFPTSKFRAATGRRLSQVAIQIVTSALGLCGEGVTWNQQIFAKVLGLGSAATAGKILKRLEECGFITMVKNYSAGNRSRVYVASNELEELLKKHGLHTAETTAPEAKINRYIEKLDVPDGRANDYYVMITRHLVAAGLPIEGIVKIMLDIDARRRHSKRRRESYFLRLVKWGKAKC